MKIVLNTGTKVTIIFLIAVILLVGYKYRINIKYFIKGFLPVTVLKQPPDVEGTKIIFFHHSTGNNIWNGGVSEWFENINKNNNKNYHIVEQHFPLEFRNYPYDYWNIWINHQGDEPYGNNPTLEMITKLYDVIIWKHCYPVGDIEEDIGKPDISSAEKRIENYKLQYNALKKKMHQFPNNKFIVWTGAVLVKNATTEQHAKRSKVFFDWVRNEWDEPGDNIFLWDFYSLETDGELYFKNEYSSGLTDSHPNIVFSKKAAVRMGQRIVDVIEGKGDTSDITGKQ